MNPTGPLAVVEALLRATNAHDLDQIESCFALEYSLEAPTHPGRSFRGRAQVRRNWTQILGAVPDLRARLLGSAVDGDTVWTEWEMSGTRRDGIGHLMRGVFVFGVAGGSIRSGRMYLEPVEQGGETIDAAVREQLGTKR
jgi:ketosteroid isomerase-like protein